MRAVVAIKASGGSGASRATRYISERDRDPEREGAGPRPLFTEHEDNLTYRGADRYLGGGDGTPDKDDLIHIAVSFRNEDYERLGETGAERKEGLREVAREAMLEMRDDLRAKELRWVAGIHLNTDNPHVHILISKDVIDRDTERGRRLGRIPRHLLPHREPGPDGSTRPVEGRIGGHFVAALDRQIERVREANERSVQPAPDQGEVKGLREWLRVESKAREADDSWNAPEREAGEAKERRDRIVLGEAIEKSLRLEFASLSYRRAKEHGETFRFRARDESTRDERQMSESDVQRRADARGARAASEQNIRNSDARRKVRQEVSERDVALHEPTLAALHTKLVELEKKLEGELSDAKRGHTSASELAQDVALKYEASGRELPPPLIARDTLNELQEQAISLTLPDRVGSLERLRVSLAAEHGQPVRDDREAARLGAQAFTARAEVSARQERAERFEQTRHLLRWEVGGERWSLGDLDRKIARQTDQARVFGKYHLHLDPRGRKAASIEAERLAGVRQELIEKIDERRGELRKETEQARKLVEVLSVAHEREALTRSENGGSMPPPEFTREELSRIEASAEVTRDAGLLRKLDGFEKSSSTPERRLGRAAAREIVAEVAYRESAERLATYKEKGDVHPLIIERRDGRLSVHQLRETKPHSVIERMLRPLLEKPAERETRAAIEAAASNSHSRLVADHERNRAYLQAAREITDGLKVEVTGRATDKTQNAPEFTAKESINLEIYAERQANPQDRDRYLRLARGEFLERTTFSTGRDHGVHTGHDRQAEQSPAHNIYARITGRGR